MCNLYRLKTSRAEIVGHFRADDTAFAGHELEKDYVSPGREAWIVREAGGTRLLDRQHWGWPNPRGGAPVVNVRNYHSPFWRSALQNPVRRCLVPFTQFQEWSVAPDPATGKKCPYWFDVPSRPIAAFAGIWRPGEQGAIFAFLTCGYGEEPAAAAAHVVGAIHPKACPVILHDDAFETWLHAPLDAALELACAFPSQLMHVEG